MDRMRGPDDVLDEETWSGGEYELAVLLGRRADDVLETAAAALWRLAGITGGTPPTRESLAASRPSRGVAVPVPGRPLACAVESLRFAEPEDEDWLYLDLPLGALAAWDPAVGGFPLGPESGAGSRAWREPLEEWLVGVARALFAEVPYVRAITGWEASALEAGAEREAEHHSVLRNDGGTLVVTPLQRWDFDGSG